MVTCIIYAAKSGVVRRVVSGIEPEEFQDHVGEGEAVVPWDDRNVKLGAYPDVSIATAIVASALGLKIIPSARCVVLDDALNVVEVIMGDPLLDKLGGHLLVQDDAALVGHVLQSDGSFLDPAAAVDAVA
jgi:hypothetical protein